MNRIQLLHLYEWNLLVSMADPNIFGRKTIPTVTVTTYL